MDHFDPGHELTEVNQGTTANSSVWTMYRGEIVTLHNAFIIQHQAVTLGFVRSRTTRVKSER
jgi:hypothetical protein